MRDICCTQKTSQKGVTVLSFAEFWDLAVQRFSSAGKHGQAEKVKHKVDPGSGKPRNRSPQKGAPNSKKQSNETLKSGAVSV
eukprot:1754823-Amphidinium_carterae.1